MAVEYDEPSSCNKCKGKNELVRPYYEDGYILMESGTKCTKCNFTDYWSHGFFESSQYMESNCKTYSFE